MSQQLNQFAMATLKGVLSMIFSPNTISVTVDPTSTATLVPGSFVKLTTTTGKAILVDVAAATDVAIGVVVANQKKISFTANDSVSIAIDGSVITLEASAAINRGVSLEYVASGAKVKTNAGANPVCGIALDPAAGNGSLFRALVRCASITGLVAALGSVVTALTPGETVEIDATLGNTFTLVPAAAVDLSITGGVAGQLVTLIVTTSGTSSFNVTPGTGFAKTAGALATGTSSGKVFTLSFRHNGTGFVETGRTAAM